MNFTRMMPNIMVADVDATVAFYHAVLGFETLETMPQQTPFDFAMLRCGGVTLMFQRQERMANRAPWFANKMVGGALEFYLEMDSGVDQLYTTLQGKVKITRELQLMPYGMKEFSFLDNNEFFITCAEKPS